MSSNKFVLTSSDGKTFEIDEAVALKSQILAHMIEEGCTDKAIPIHNVTGDILAKIIEYCKKHVEISSEDEESKKKLEKWDTGFMKLDLETLFKIVVAANYFDIKGLTELTCQRIADLIKDKMPEEIREIFNIENDFTPEEEAQIRKENEWAFK